MRKLVLARGGHALHCEFEITATRKGFPTVAATRTSVKTPRGPRGAIAEALRLERASQICCNEESCGKAFSSAEIQSIVRSIDPPSRTAAVPVNASCKCSPLK